MHDVFISYEHESKSIADNVVSVLESNRIRCWYAPRDVIGDYATSIVEAINSCKVFVLILNDRASNSPQVLNEVEMAYKRILTGEINIVPFKLDDENLSMAMEYYIKRLHWIDAENASLENAIDDLLKQIEELMPAGSVGSEEGLIPTRQIKRSSNKYFTDSDAKELSRLKTQEDLLLAFDRPVYEQVLAGKSDLAVLDIGSNDGLAVMSRLGSRDEVTALLGVEWDAGAAASANERYGTDSIVFAQCDCESPELAQTVSAYLDEHGLTGFDILNLSMIILHLQKPYKLLRQLRKFLNPGACVVIRDIDDGLNLAYPDPDGSFARATRICDYLETSGFRTSGRQIYGMLRKAGYRDIRVEKQGLNTAGMNHDQRSALFDTYFSFVTDDLAIMCQRHPDSERCAEDRAWFEDVYDDMEEAFQDDCFFFNGGFMIFTARA